MVDITTNDPFENDLSWTGVVLIANIPGTITCHTYNKLQSLILQRSLLSWKKEHFNHRFVYCQLFKEMCHLIDQLSCTSTWRMKNKVLTKSSFAFSCLLEIFPFDGWWCLISSGRLKLYLCDWERVSDCCSNIRV